MATIYHKYATHLRKRLRGNKWALMAAQDAEDFLEDAPVNLAVDDMAAEVNETVSFAASLKAMGYESDADEELLYAYVLKHLIRTFEALAGFKKYVRLSI